MTQNIPIDNSDNKKFKQPHVVLVFALVGMSITAVMACIALYNQNILLAAGLFFSSIVFFSGYYVHKKFNKVALSSAIILYSLYLLMFYLVYTGGVENTGPLWIYIVAPVSVFIHGLKRGLIDIAAFVVVISTIMFMPDELIDHAIYSTEFKLRLLYSFLTVTFLSALYEYSREQSFLHTLELSKKYQQLAHYDPLTKLSNRRDALCILKQEQDRIARNKEPLSLILCDIDHFKKVNDHYGHNAGDSVLRDLAKVFSGAVRAQDSIARWGGEEFLFILPQTPASNARIIAQKIQDKLNNHTINYEGMLINITVSMGIAQCMGEQTIDEVINLADKYLYQAKDAGRNQIFPRD